MADVQTPPHALETHLSAPSFTPSERNKQTISPITAASSWSLPPSGWTPICHPQVDKVSQEVDDYFLREWNFPNARSKKVFVGAGFSRVTCLYFPLAEDDRIHFACRLLTVLFLIDDVLEELSLVDGEVYNAKLMPIMRGDVLPNRM